MTSRLDIELASIEIGDVNELNAFITTTVRECVNEVCPKLEVVKKREPWEDAELIEKMKNLCKRSKHENVRKLKKAIKKRRTKLKNAYYHELAESINNADAAREVQKEFALAKKYTAIRAGSKLAISNDKLKRHFEPQFATSPVPLPPELAEPE